MHDDVKNDRRQLGSVADEIHQNAIKIDHYFYRRTIILNLIAERKMKQFSISKQFVGV